MGGSSSQPRTNPAMSPINAFTVENLYTPEFSESLQENIGYLQKPNPHKYPVEQVAISPTKKKKSTRNRQKRTIQSDDAPRQITWTTEEEIALAKATTIKMRCRKNAKRPKGMDKARAARKNKGLKASGSSTINDNALARLMVTEMTAAEKEQREAFL
ncbi:hypothetical protein Tco_1042402 [Tanacetum coccineum]|uniref:Uncharacterized protein n=1 Tax=Tanacetum coccineum TaxID=301880 RepID=A0ABQ5GIZ4_9ASTR